MTLPIGKGKFMKSVNYHHTQLPGETGKLLRGITAQWLIGIRESNPAILDMFRDRDRRPYRDMLPWSGEFAGKYLTGAAYVYRITGNPELYDYIQKFIEELLLFQDEEGYLGCYSKECRLTGAYSTAPTEYNQTWDAWNHYHCMFGLLQWYDLTGNQTYFCSIEKAAALFMRSFFGQKKTLLSIGWPEMNLAVYHIFAILYRRTGKEEYLRFAQMVENDIETEGAGKYMYYALRGYPYYKCPKPRWESLHAIMGYAEMYRSTGQERYREALLQIFYSILKTDVHNTGAFSTNEQAIGDPCRNGRIETCCVVAYNALAIEAFGLTGDLRIIDFLERAHYNAVLGCYSPTGRWSTYHTPMEGNKCANFQSINFQCRPGSPELNCCSVNAPRGVAAVGDWWLTRQENKLFLNFYEDAELETDLGERVTIAGGYPASSVVHITVEGLQDSHSMLLRIPAWSTHTKVQIGETCYYPQAGSYWELPCEETKTVVTVSFDFTPCIEKGSGDYTGRSSVYIGPVLYGFDVGDNEIFWEELPAISGKSLTGLTPKRHEDGSIRLNLPEGIVLKDFYHLGASGSWYSSWLPIEE